MKNIIEQFRALRHKKAKLAAALILALLIAIPFPVWAWLVQRRKVGGIVQIHSPYVLTITAAREQAIEYLDLSSIDLHAQTNGTRAKYYVFCVCGSDTMFYNLQLAYTTNNQFEYHIYPAMECSGDDPQQLYRYQERDSNGKPVENKVYYYKKSTADPLELAGTNEVRCYPLKSAGLLNLESGSELLANSSKHGATYEVKCDSAFSVQKNAEPLYWQAKGIRSGLAPDAASDSARFVDYYILEINWEHEYSRQNEGSAELQELDNKRETDIIYITAKAASYSKVQAYEEELAQR